MGSRKSINPNVTQKILTRSARRCCLCFFLDHDHSEKRGQIAHLDKNPANNKIDNLAYLCQHHHDMYDSKTSQTKGYTIKEVKQYREQLHKIIEQKNRETTKMLALDDLTKSELIILEEIKAAPTLDSCVPYTYLLVSRQVQKEELQILISDLVEKGYVTINNGNICLTLKTKRYFAKKLQ